jgi:hypothetical protein
MYPFCQAKKQKCPLNFSIRQRYPKKFERKKKSSLVAHGSANPRPTTAAVGLSPLFFLIKGIFVIWRTLQIFGSLEAH